MRQFTSLVHVGIAKATVK